MSTDWKSIYTDLCNEIEILQIRSSEIECELNYVQKSIENHCTPSTKLVASYTGMPGAGFVPAAFDKLWSNLFNLEIQRDEINDIMSLKYEARNRMESKMSEFEGLENKVIVMRDIQRKTLIEIADELGYSYDWIRKVSSRVNKLYNINVKKGTIKAQIS